MARVLIGALSATVALLAMTAVSAAEDGAGGLPLRKSGKWEMKTVMDEGFGPREQVLTMCVDAAMERNTAAASDQSHKKSCEKYEVKKSDGTTTVEAVCVFEGRNVESTTEMSGDFENDFKVTIKSRTSGSERGQSIVVNRTITQTGRYLGTSCGDLQAGEAMGSDGHKIMVQ